MILVAIGLLVAVLGAFLWLAPKPSASTAFRDAELQRLQAEALAVAQKAADQAYEAGIAAALRTPASARGVGAGRELSDGYREPNTVEGVPLSRAMEVIDGLRPPEIEICFTGFMDDDKVGLLAVAIRAGWRVRTNVTKHLVFLCVGPNAGPSKVEHARAQDVDIIDEAVFRQLTVRD